MGLDARPFVAILGPIRSNSVPKSRHSWPIIRLNMTKMTKNRLSLQPWHPESASYLSIYPLIFLVLLPVLWPLSVFLLIGFHFRSLVVLSSLLFHFRSLVVFLHPLPVLFLDFGPSIIRLTPAPLRTEPMILPLLLERRSALVAVSYLMLFLGFATMRYVH